MAAPSAAKLRVLFPGVTGHAIVETADRIRGQDREQGIDHQPVAELRVSNVIGQRKKHQREEEQGCQAEAASLPQAPDARRSQRRLSTPHGERRTRTQPGFRFRSRNGCISPRSVQERDRMSANVGRGKRRLVLHVSTSPLAAYWSYSHRLNSGNCDSSRNPVAPEAVAHP